MGETRPKKKEKICYERWKYFMKANEKWKFEVKRVWKMKLAPLNKKDGQKSLLSTRKLLIFLTSSFFQSSNGRSWNFEDRSDRKLRREFWKQAEGKYHKYKEDYKIRITDYAISYILWIPKIFVTIQFKCVFLLFIKKQLVRIV